MKEFRNPPDVHAPVGGYSHQVEIRGNERLLIISGQVGMRPDGSVPEDAIEQLEIACENLIRNLHAAQMDVQDIVKVNFYLVYEPTAGDRTAERRQMTAAKFGGHRACSTLVYVPALAAPIFKVELEGWASREV
ncbi:MAG TPA: RidA family protein [Anaerolineales bacterium]